MMFWLRDKARVMSSKTTSERVHESKELLLLLAKLSGFIEVAREGHNPIELTIEALDGGPELKLLLGHGTAAHSFECRGALIDVLEDTHATLSEVLARRMAV